MESSVMLGSISFFYTTAFRRFLGDGFFAMTMAIRRRWQPPKGGCIIIAPGWLAYLGSVAE